MAPATSLSITVTQPLPSTIFPLTVRFSVQAVKDMLRYFYLGSYNNVPIPKDASAIDQLELLATQDARL
jgi:hypothetical protein